MLFFWNMARTGLIALILSGLGLTAFAQTGHRITVGLQGHPSDTLFLGYHYGNKQYIRDTVLRSPDDTFVFSGEEALEPGMYLVVLPPDNQYFQLLLGEGDQHFSVRTSVGDLNGAMQIEGSAENQLFYDYLRFLDAQRQKARDLAQSGAGRNDPRVLEINDVVAARQAEILEAHPESYTAAIIRANQPVDPPAFTGTPQEVEERQWRFYQKHYFDHLDLADPRMLRTPFLYERVDYYVNKLQVQHPDTISRAIDTVLTRMRPAPESFKFYLVHFLNTYAGSNIVGMDAVYVHLAENYYAQGEAPWTSDEQRQEIVDNARRLKPLLVGKVAPDIIVQRRDGSEVSLHAVDAPYTILYFWRYDCGHCKQSTPHLKSFYEDFADRGVALFAVCVKKDEEEIGGCWEYVDEQGIGDWIHTVDPGYRSLFPVKYFIQSTPQIYVLGPDKTILSKRISAEQLPEVMASILENDEDPDTGAANR